ncbi:hypothetical protein [Halobacterium zhouii]|uniref:hypothetical protein n=1 Tax=Halobacterium zhouii TaxID=2902624 RepID=UPI001E4C50BD|nr:hypothetical protein [Halobacterium zhouii]
MGEGDTSPESDADAASESAEESTSRWSLLAVGGGLSLCCLFAAPAATGVAGGTAAGGATAALGGGLVRIAVAALTVGLVGFVIRWRSDSSCDR